MALELRDLRAKLQLVENDAMLDAVGRVMGKDRSEIAREILHRWALEQLEIGKVARKRMDHEGG